ncbi:MAG: M4 family metallopeptidase [Acidimicrobiales bacterium]|nr:M4 family metallopeptidase [Acidimicrobiales bacterium]
MSTARRWVVGAVAAASAVVGLPVAATAVPAPLPTGLAVLQSGVSGSLDSGRDADGDLEFVGTADGQALTGAGDATTNATSVLTTLGADFGSADGTTFAATGTSTTPDGTGVRFQQSIDGVPVLAGEVAVQTDAAGQVRSVLGETADDAPASMSPTVAAADAATAARAASAKAHGLGAVPLVASRPELWIYDPTLVGSPDPVGTRLVWRVRVEASAGPDGQPIADLVLVDAANGSIALRIDDVHAAKNRRVCDAANTSAKYPCTSGFARVEGGAASGVTDVNKAYDFAGDVYDFYNTRFGRDSLDGAGMIITSTVRYCPSGCPFNNAFWDGEQIVYGPGFASVDDIVGHELTHGVTQHEANLFYYMQSGAINESMSDIFGEFVDLTNGAGNDAAGVRWLMGEDIPGGAGRNMANPAQFNQPDRMRSPRYWSDLADNGGVHYNSGVGNKAAVLIVDGGAFNGQSISGIGIDKAARIYYSVLTSFLVSGSDYADLAKALPQACTNLIGTGGITAGDCNQVAKAVVATEMDRQPVTGAAAPDAPDCDIATQTPTTIYAEDWETGTDGWVYDPATWDLEDGTVILGEPDNVSPYATSGTHSMLAVGGPAVTDHKVAKSTNIAVPAGSQSYLRFNHWHSFEYGGGGQLYEGGVLEYSLNGGAWLDAGSRITENGYNGTVTSGFANPLAGRQAWTKFTWGFQAVRVDLSSFGGQNVRFRWRLGTDNEAAASIWNIDDVQVIACEARRTGFHPVTPARLLDTRDGTGTGAAGKVNGGSSIDLQVTGRGGVPATGVSAVVLNVTAVGPTATSHVTVWPAGVGMPLASNLNVVPGQTVPNLVKVGIGDGGRVSLFNNSGQIDLLADVVGWYDEGTEPVTAFPTDAITGDLYNAVTPARVLDTRDGTGRNGTVAKVAGGSSIDLTVTGVGGVPADATAVAVNMTVTNATAASHLTVWPKGVTMPVASNLNFNAGTTIPNMVIVGVGTGGKISIFNNSGQTDVIGDVVGYYKASGSAFVPVKPARILDSRFGTGGYNTPWGAAVQRTVTINGQGGVPPAGATAVVLNVTAVGATAPSHVTAWPNGVSMPVASNLNFSTGQTIPNLVVVGIGSGGQIRLFNNAGSVHLIADVVGYFVPVDA